MGSINITGVKKSKPQATPDQPNPNITVEESYTYKDIKLDIQYTNLSNNIAVDSYRSVPDIADLRDVEDIKQSVFNLLSTIPGQKLLNPLFGLNLSVYCFEPVTQITADRIARTILIEVPKFEPRINIKNLQVIGDTEVGTYELSFIIGIKNSNAREVRFKGIVNSDGFKFSN